MRIIFQQEEKPMTTKSKRVSAGAMLVAAIAMLVLWAVLTFMFEAPGYVHLLLTAGVFLLIWRIVVRGSPKK